MMNTLTAILTALVLPGLVLLILGLRGRRVGSEPRCRRCEYDLTGLDHVACPECGTDHADKPPRVGKRKRRRGGIILGAVLLSGSIAGAVTWSRGLDWYGIAPIRALLWLADQGDSRALLILEWRYLDAGLSQAEEARLASMCLAKQGLATVEAPWQEWIDLLKQLDEDGLLTPEQQATYYRQVVGPYRLEVRDPMANGRPVVAEFVYVVRAPTFGLYTQPYDERLTVGESTLTAVEVREKYGDGVTEVRRRVITAPLRGSGQYDIRYTADIGVGRDFGLFDDRSLAAVIVRADARASFAFLELGRPGLARVADSQMVQPLQHAIRIATSDVEFVSEGGERGRLSEVEIDVVRPMPVAVAFDVFLRDYAGDRRIGTFSCAKGATNCTLEYDFYTISAVELQGADRMIVFVTNANIAHKTVDLHEIWDGELTFGPVWIGRYDETAGDLVGSIVPDVP